MAVQNFFTPDTTSTFVVPPHAPGSLKATLIGGFGGYGFGDGADGEGGRGGKVVVYLTLPVAASVTVHTGANGADGVDGSVIPGDPSEWSGGGAGRRAGCGGKASRILWGSTLLAVAGGGGGSTEDFSGGSGGRWSSAGEEVVSGAGYAVGGGAGGAPGFPGSATGGNGGFTSPGSGGSHDVNGPGLDGDPGLGTHGGDGAPGGAVNPGPPIYGGGGGGGGYYGGGGGGDGWSNVPPGGTPPYYWAPGAAGGGGASWWHSGLCYSHYSYSVSPPPLGSGGRIWFEWSSDPSYGDCDTVIALNASTSSGNRFYTYTGSASQFIVPHHQPGTLYARVVGGNGGATLGTVGGGRPGGGGSISGYLANLPTGTVLDVSPGSSGGQAVAWNGTVGAGGAAGLNAWSDYSGGAGGDGGAGGRAYSGGGGGGGAASVVRLGGTDIIVAGGGGGETVDIYGTSRSGGHGGISAWAFNGTSGGAGGGTQVAPGAGNGGSQSGYGHHGGDGIDTGYYGGAGGGGGLFGGGGGYSGGGGSSLHNATYIPSPGFDGFNGYGASSTGILFTWTARPVWLTGNAGVIAANPDKVATTPGLNATKNVYSFSLTVNGTGYTAAGSQTLRVRDPGNTTDLAGTWYWSGSSDSNAGGVTPPNWTGSRALIFVFTTPTPPSNFLVIAEIPLSGVTTITEWALNHDCETVIHRVSVGMILAN